jgi:hypothetical protein
VLDSTACVVHVLEPAATEDQVLDPSETADHVFASTAAGVQVFASSATGDHSSPNTYKDEMSVPTPCTWACMFAMKLIAAVNEPDPVISACTLCGKSRKRR